MAKKSQHLARALVIVESPAKAKTINRYLGSDYTVMASMGHVRDLPPKEFGIDLDSGFEPTYEILADKKRVVSELRKAAAGVEEVYLATDLDREGEAIAWHLAHALGMSVAAIGFSLIPLVGDSLVLSLVGLFIGIAGFEFTIVSAIPFATEIRPLARTRFLSLMTLSAGLGRAAGAYVGVRLFAEFGYSADAWAAAALNVFGIAVLFALVRPDTAAAQSGNLAR